MTIYVLFFNNQLLARGSLEEIIECSALFKAGDLADVSLMDEATGRAVDIDWRGERDEILGRATDQLAMTTRGRPRLGVEGREVTLLPRHWQWLESRGRSASAELRSLVDAAMRGSAAGREGVDALYRQMSFLAGDCPGFEDAARALYRGDSEGFEAAVAGWPGDLPAYFSERARAISPSSR